jgi:hypothetical protein
MTDKERFARDDQRPCGCGKCAPPADRRQVLGWLAGSIAFVQLGPAAAQSDLLDPGKLGKSGAAAKALARLNQASPALLGDLPDMPRWLERPEIGGYLEDLIGRPQFEAVGKFLVAKAEERRKTDEARRA